MITAGNQEEDALLAEAAEAQLLNEAGIEPLPADSISSPMKKAVKEALFDTKATRSELESEPQIETEEPLVSLRHDLADLNPEVTRENLAEFHDELANQSSLRIGDSFAVEVTDSLPPPSVDSVFELRLDGGQNKEGATSTVDSDTVTAAMPEKVSRNFNIDIFGSPGGPEGNDPENVSADGAQQEQAIISSKPQLPTPPFAISLNDETVNLGALLASNDNLSASIHGDMIELEMADSDGEEEASVEISITSILKQPEPEYEDDRPDELSTDVDPAGASITTEADAQQHMEDDKAKLSSFLKRVQAAKDRRSATTTRRESLQNRRDSDVVRRALASPRQALEEKDANQSPQRALNAQQESTINLDTVLQSPLARQDVRISPRQPLPMLDDGEPDELSEQQTGSPRRRSTRVKSTRATTSGPNRISVRTDGGEMVSLNRTEAQQMTDIVRRNTKKNKGASLSAPQRLARLKLESLALVVDGDSPVGKTVFKEGVRNVTWRENLVEYSSSVATADLEMVAAECEIAPGMGTLTEASADRPAPKKSGTSKLRRLRGLGAANGTPAKNVLQSTLMPDEAAEQKAAADASAKEVKKTARKSRIATPASAAPIASEPSAEAEVKSADAVKPQRKSRLPPPKKLNLNPSLSSLPVLQGQENLVGLSSPAKKLSKIPAPSGTGTPAPAFTAGDLTSGLRPPAKRLRGMGRK